MNTGCICSDVTRTHQTRRSRLGPSTLRFPQCNSPSRLRSSNMSPVGQNTKEASRLRFQRRHRRRPRGTFDRSPVGESMRMRLDDKILPVRMEIRNVAEVAIGDTCRSGSPRCCRLMSRRARGTRPQRRCRYPECRTRILSNPSCIGTGFQAGKRRARCNGSLGNDLAESSAAVPVNGHHLT